MTDSKSAEATPKSPTKIVGTPSHSSSPIGPTNQSTFFARSSSSSSTSPTLKIEEQKSPLFQLTEGELNGYREGEKFYLLGNYSKALPGLEQAAKLNYPPALLLLWRIYSAPRYGIPQDEKRAQTYRVAAARCYPWFEEQASKWYAEEQYYLGLCYEYGIGVTQDAEQAVHWYRAAAGQKNARGQCKFGESYATGRGLAKKDTREAVRWYRASAEQGDAQGQCNLGSCYATGEGVPQDYKEALRWFQASAAQEHASGQLNLGWCYANWIGVTQNYEDAVRWYRAAAEQGHASGQFHLGWSYERARGIHQDAKEAMRWYRAAAEQGHASGQFHLGLCYRDGTGVAKDRARALYWFELAAKQGNTGAQGQLKALRAQCPTLTPRPPSPLVGTQHPLVPIGEQKSPLFQLTEEALNGYREGEKFYLLENYSKALPGLVQAAELNYPPALLRLAHIYSAPRYKIPKDEKRAQTYRAAAALCFPWFKEQAGKEHAEEQYYLGLCYDHGIGVTQDAKQAVRWYRAAAEQGYASGQCNLGHCYTQGRGIPQDYIEAVRWYRAAADQGHVRGQYYLGWCYDLGKGVPEDYKEAVRWYRAAAEQGYASGQCNLGYCYTQGRGIPQDYIEAVRWYRAAADQGHVRGQYYLGLCYRNGAGVAKDPAKALYWFELAATQGNKEAQNQLKALQAQYPSLTPRPPTPLAGAQHLFLPPPDKKNSTDTDQASSQSVSITQPTTTVTPGLGNPP